MQAEKRALIFPNFTVLRASSGSGKTRALSRRFVRFLLSEGVEKNRLNNLLAITFTNNAAKEMKERILTLLKQLHLGDGDVLEDFCREFSLSPDVVRERAGVQIEAILSRYSDFQVKTIDSFMATVFKASALDFGYNPDFEIMMDNKALMGYAFELFLRRVREGTREGRLMEEVIDLIMGNRREASYLWEATREILLRTEEIYRKLSSCGRPVRRTDYRALADAAAGEIAACMDTLEDLVGRSGLAVNGRSTYQRLLASVRAGRPAECVGRGMKTFPVCKPRGGDGHDAYHEIAEEWERLSALIASYARHYARAYYTPYVRAYEAFSAILEQAKRREAKIFIEDVNKRLAEYLSADLVPDLYFRLGEVIFHFLIDEFQDTSPVQWQNLMPLVENSLSQGGSLFVVGDTKQAIYGFRDADYRIMAGVERENPFPSAYHVKESLDTNYRSGGAIVDFAAHVFREVLPGIDTLRRAADESGLTDYCQASKPGHERRGYVETCILPKNGEEPPERDRLLALIEGCRARGYAYSDVAVLTRRNDDVVKITSWLNAGKVPFVSYSSLDIRRRKVTGEIIALVTFLDSPLDDLAFATFILGDLFRAVLERDGRSYPAAAFHDMCFRNRGRARRPLYKVFQDEAAGLWKDYIDRLFRLSGYLPLYDLVVEVYRVFRVFGLFGGEEAALSRVLEIIKDLEVKDGGTMREFLRSAVAEGGDEAMWNIDVPSGVDAVKVMTVHKAKGLGIPVVIVLLYGERKKGARYIVEEDEDGVGLLRLTRETLGVDPSFDRRYEQEETKELANKLNSLYVAFTRAESELYVIGVRGETDTVAFPFALLPAPGPWSMGSLPEAPAGGVAPEGLSAVALHHGAAADIPRAPDEYLRVEEKRRGEAVHRLLALIDTGQGDIRSRLDAILPTVRREMGEEAAPEDLKEVVASFIGDEAVAPLFEVRPGRAIMVEQEVSDATGRLFRVDRIVVDPGEVTVIEYKTGREEEYEESHRAQMANYLRLVGEIFEGRRVRGLLAYVDLRRVRHVAPGGEDG